MLLVVVVVRSGAVNAKMDQRSRRVIVSQSLQRTFGRPQWLQLNEQLRDWQQNVAHVLSGLVNTSKSLQQQTNAATTR